MVTTSKVRWSVVAKDHSVSWQVKRVIVDELDYLVSDKRRHGGQSVRIAVNDGSGKKLYDASWTLEAIRELGGATATVGHIQGVIDGGH